MRGNKTFILSIYKNILTFISSALKLKTYNYIFYMFRRFGRFDGFFLSVLLKFTNLFDNHFTKVLSFSFKPYFQKKKKNLQLF
jgi:hypothetical protein